MILWSALEGHFALLLSSFFIFRPNNLWVSPPYGDHHFRAKAITIEADPTSDIGPQQGLGCSQTSRRRDCQGKLPQTIAPRLCSLPDGIIFEEH